MPTPTDPRPEQNPRREPSPLDELNRAFTLLIAGPKPPAIDGARLGHGLPQRAIELGELKAITLHPATGREARDAVWRELLARARDRQATWMVGAAGIAEPGLRRIAGRIAAGFAGDTTDLDAEVLAGFVLAVHYCDPAKPNIAARLCWAAFRAGLAARRATESRPLPAREPDQITSAEPRSGGLEQEEPGAARGHPDLVLYGAVAQGVLTAVQAELIGRTRIEHLSLAQAAAQLGIPARWASTLRRRGELRLLRALDDEAVSLLPPAPPAESSPAPQQPSPKPPGTHREADQAACGWERPLVSPDNTSRPPTQPKGGDGPDPTRTPTPTAPDGSAKAGDAPQNHAPSARYDRIRQETEGPDR
ncbi:hypothetical protein DP939_25230 [Spongiactinospora rosea]|uniref:Uncharacterized protein n=1 Tax=Spongiactinospora rosea TaxID=2248750 RepID=A0A366LVN9_9ACTN|nr:hypothetical protein [Spongiactinospora rosea]RBQ17252.1 hypothetical protein DP939_25230 [Spongiactinospora rosea]